MSFGLPLVPSLYIRGLPLGLLSTCSVFGLCFVSFFWCSFEGPSIIGLPRFLWSFDCSTLSFLGLPFFFGSYSGCSIVKVWAIFMYFYICYFLLIYIKRVKLYLIYYVVFLSIFEYFLWTYILVDMITHNPLVLSSSDMSVL